MLFVITALICAGLLSMTSAVHPQGNSACRCLFAFNTFPATFVVNSVEQGTLTETLSCSSTTNDCSITGNITWTAAIACYTGANGPWSTTYSYSLDNINSVFQYITTCTGSHSNVHQGTTASCTSSGINIAATGEIRDFNNANIGTAARGWTCKL
jgi:hypothetical protein